MGKKSCRRWAVVYALTAVTQIAALFWLTLCGIYQTFVGTLLAVVLAADAAFLSVCSVIFWRKGREDE